MRGSNSAESGAVVQICNKFGIQTLKQRTQDWKTSSRRGSLTRVINCVMNQKMEPLIKL